MTEPLPMGNMLPGRPGPPGPLGAAGGPAGGHLDELTAMRLADGEPVDAPAAGHAAGCAFCAGLVSAFRAEGTALAAALALDESELAVLAAAGIPARAAVAARAYAPFRGVQQDTPASLLAMLITAVAGYAGWLFVQPVLAGGLDFALRTGAVTVATQYLTGLLFSLLWAFWDAFQTAESLRLLEAPALPLFLLAFLGWLAIGLLPRLSPSPEAAGIAPGAA